MYKDCKKIRVQNAPAFLNYAFCGLIDFAEFDYGIVIDCRLVKLVVGVYESVTESVSRSALAAEYVLTDIS